MVASVTNYANPLLQKNNLQGPEKISQPFGFHPTIPEKFDMTNWKKRIFTVIDKQEKKLDLLMPSSEFQRNFDIISTDISKESSQVKEFDNWLENNGHGAWYEQLAIFLAKLPLKAGRNIVRIIFNIIKIGIGAPAYLLMHPLKAPLILAKILVELVISLLEPETWSKIGGGLLGSSLGYAAVAGGPLGLISFGIGAAMVIGGISLGTLKTALLVQKDSRKGAVSKYLITQFKQLSENVLTGFCMVMLVEAVQQTIRGIQKLDHTARYSRAKRLSKENYSKTKVDNFLKENNLPKYDRMRSGDQTVSISWHHDKFNNVNVPRDIPGSHFFTESVHTHNVYPTNLQYNWSTNEFEVVTRSVPVYEPFEGFKISIADWQAPLEPTLGERVRLADNIMTNLGLSVAGYANQKQSEAALICNSHRASEITKKL